MDKTHSPGSGPVDGGVKSSYLYPMGNFGHRLLLFIPFLLSFFYGISIQSQPLLHSVIQGYVFELQAQAPVPGATVTILDSDPLIGTTTDENGYFRLSKVPIGTRQLKVSHIGYAPYLSEPLTVSSGKETPVTVFLEPAAISAPEVEIHGGFRKYASINKMATVSVRSFSVDETGRFAGSYNDPARMAANFAGVTSGIDNRNDIIVRGNSPMGMQWRIEDMEIPNPNHFATVGTTGGPVTLLNNNLLTNSDFFTGAFPAQYGNTLAGIFDMRMRNGNNHHHEYWFQVGWNGLEFGTEGPFSKKSLASYIVSYRYSPLQFLNWFNINVGIVPKYQDLNLKITIPTRKSGTFTIIGIGGLSYIELFDSRKDQDEWTFPDLGEDLANGSNLGVIGLTHQINPGAGWRWKNMIYLVASDVKTKIDTFSNSVLTPAPWAGERSTEVKYSFASRLTKKISDANTIDAGVFIDWYRMSFSDSMMYFNQFLVNTDSREAMLQTSGYLQWKHDFTPSFTITTGVTGSWLSLSNQWTLEPRAGFDWYIHKKHTLNFGAGLYSQMQPRVIYFVLSHPVEGPETQTNLRLGSTRAAQVVLGYNYLLSETLRFKTELYYQYLWDIPVKESIPQYALCNQGHDFFLDRQYADSLVNKGTGVNYGIECTFEKFFKRNYFFLLTASLFNSTYRGYDQTNRNSAFNVNYVLNAVGGYEWVMGKRKWGVMSLGLRATWAGGNPYIPYNAAATVATGEPVYDWNEAFEPRYPEYKRASLRFGIRRNLPGYNIEFLLDLQYRTNYTNVALQRIDPKTGEIKYFFTMGFFPMGTWRIQF